MALFFARYPEHEYYKPSNQLEEIPCIAYEQSDFLLVPVVRLHKESDFGHKLLREEVIEVN